jgi:Contractile injection system tube protein
MPDPANLARAELRQLDADFDREIEPDTWCTVQFNPESMKVAFANQLVQPTGAGDQRGSPARQFVGAGTTKLSLQLWFDVTAEQPPGQSFDDVRRLTQKVAYFITPKTPGRRAGQFVPPAVRFIWGSFQFDGLMDSLEESLEFFSPAGRPLRASTTIALSQQRITEFHFGRANADGNLGSATGAVPSTPGADQLAQADQDSTVQSLAGAAGRDADWQSIAAANGIENPRFIAPGTLLDLNVTAPTLDLRFGIAS